MSAHDADSGYLRSAGSYCTGCHKNEQVKTKSGKRYGYDAKGKMIKNQWGKSSSGCIYYFQKNGAAYQADKDFQGRYGIVIKKIDNKYYGFDVYGHRVTGFHMASTKLYGNAILYYFTQVQY